MPDKILIVDDESDILNLAKVILEKNGFRVVDASDGDEALVKAEAEMPDLVLLDVVMPGRSGLEICKILKTQVTTKHTPVVMFTVLGRDVDRKLGTEAGADGQLTKPFTSDALLTEVKLHLDKTRADNFQTPRVRPGSGGPGGH